MTFLPRVELALHLAEKYQINAATDASDSLSLDLNAMLSASDLMLGADLELEAIPISDQVQETDPAQRLNRALTDGEDFELILAVAPDQVDQLLADQWLATKQCLLTRIGTFTDQHKQLMATADGEQIEIQPSGYIH